ncbi:hypothetical protein [Plantactinospora sp. WMMB782]|uniref:hypothetical protein n=1 Tax=Plantactinospora sp. WMMB782 TaxID=3404121 RepID=UPI003B95FEA0
MPDVWAIMRAIRGSNLPHTDRHILLTLASLAEPTTGVIPDRYMPSLTDLAGMTGLGRSTVARRMPLIEEAGWVKKSAPSKRAAWKDKETNSYALLIPISTSPAERLVPEGDQSQSGTSPGAGPELVPERDSTSPRAGHEVPNLSTNEPSSPTERTEAETLFVVDAPPKTPRPRKPSTPPGDEQPNAKEIVAAFIDGARERRRTVTGDLIKQVGATAKRILAQGEVPHDVLINAAREMGRNGWRDLNMQLLRGTDQANSNGYRSQKVNHDEPGAHKRSWDRRRQQHAQQ